MEKFIQKNYIWLGIVAVLLVVLIVKGNSSKNTKAIENLNNSSVAVPTTAQVENSDDLQFKCAQLGAAAKSAYEAKYPDISQVLITDAIFHYNTRLHTCFYGRELHFKNQDGSGSVWQGITDMYSNKDVLYNWDIFSVDNKFVGDFGAINYIGYPNEQGGGVIKSRVEFETLYNKTLTE